MDNNYSGLFYDKESVEQAISLLIEGRIILFDADNEIYEAIRDLSSVNGFHLIEAETTSIDINIAEKITTNLIEATERIINVTNNMSTTISEYATKMPETPNTIKAEDVFATEEVIGPTIQFRVSGRTITTTNKTSGSSSNKSSSSASNKTSSSSSNKSSSGSSYSRTTISTEPHNMIPVTEPYNRTPAATEQNYQSPDNVQIENEYVPIPNTSVSADSTQNDSSFYPKALLGIGAATTLASINR